MTTYTTPTRTSPGLPTWCCTGWPGGGPKTRPYVSWSVGKPGRVVQRNDAAAEVAPPDVRPAGPRDLLGQQSLIGPGPHRLGEVDISVRAARYAPCDRRQCAHQVFHIDRAER